jgi:transposase
MTGNPCWQAIPTKLSLEQFEQFVLPRLRRGRHGPAPQVSLYRIFNYILQLLYMGCQWKALPIEKNDKGRPEIHYTPIYRTLRRWLAAGCMDAIFAGSVRKLHEDQLLDLTVIYGDGTRRPRKKGLCRDKVGKARKLRHDKESLCQQRIELTGSSSGNAVSLHLTFPDHMHCLNA